MRASWQLSPCYYFAAFTRLVEGKVIALHFSLTIEARISLRISLHHESLTSTDFFQIDCRFYSHISIDTQKLCYTSVTKKEKWNVEVTLRWVKRQCWTWFLFDLEKMLWSSRFPDLISLKLTVNCLCMWIRAVAAVVGCLCFGCLSRSCSECLGHSGHRCWGCGSAVRSTLLVYWLVPTELCEIKLGYGMGLFPALSNNRIDWITCRAVIQVFTINWIFIDAQREGHSRKRGKITFSLQSSKEWIHLQSCIKSCRLFSKKKKEWYVSLSCIRSRWICAG